MDGKRKAAILFQTLMSKSKKRQKKEEELEDLLSSLNEDVESEEEVDADMAAIGAVSFAAVTDSTSNRSSRPRAAAIDRKNFFPAAFLDIFFFFRSSRSSSHNNTQEQKKLWRHEVRSYIFLRQWQCNGIREHNRENLKLT